MTEVPKPFVVGSLRQKEFSMEVFLIAYQIIEYAVSIIPQPRLYRRKP